MITAASTMPATVTTLPAGSQLPTATTGTSGISGGQTLTENNFLQLLTAQLEHQDPLDPMTNDAFAAELAQFSTASGVQDLNTSFSGQQAVALVGHNVAVSGNALVLSQSTSTSGSSGESATGAFDLSSAANNVTVTITNSAGQAVTTLNLGAMAAGVQTFSWNGQNSGGTRQSPGTYQFTVSATSASGSSVAALPYAVVPVTAVALSSQNGPMLDLGGGLAPVAVSAVQQVF
jgi:flagellar basal-body rod modification protein FlgD